MFYQLPPVGNPLRLSRERGAPPASSLSTQSVRFYQSGTAALASAVLAAIRQHDKASDPSSAEVLLPAYACPDLISAVLYAGAKPVLVDLQVERPWMDVEQLVSRLSSDTVAIIAVNLFGIAEDWANLQRVAAQHDLVLIEDSAQYYPGHGEAVDWHGDLVVLSFGRGKPVSLLGGGAVIANGDRSDELLELLEYRESCEASLLSRLIFTIKARLYNMMISPYLYWLPQSLPFLHLGETRYHTLHEIEAMTLLQGELLAANLASYQSDASVGQRSERYSMMLGFTGNKIIDLPQVCGGDGHRRLLRYPILVDAAVRDDIYHAMNRAGLGVSILYPSSLPKISGLENILDQSQRFANAETFSKRLITLPMHSGVRQKDIDKMAAILNQLAR